MSCLEYHFDVQFLQKTEVKNQIELLVFSFSRNRSVPNV
jgi:hypothetical protein